MEGSSGWPGHRSPSIQALRRSGIPGAAAAASMTSGNCRARSTISAKADRRSGGGDPGLVRGKTCAVSTWSLRKPASMRITLTKLPMKSDAPTRSTTASATSATTRAARTRRRPRLVPPPRVLAVSAVESAGLDPCSAGPMPETSPVANAATAATASTRASMPIVATRARFSGKAVASTRTESQASARPTMVPATDTTRLSIRTRWTSRPRLAPSAARTAASRCCTEARASQRFATFAHAMSSTMATAARSMSIHNRVELPTM